MSRFVIDVEIARTGAFVAQNASDQRYAFVQEAFEYYDEATDTLWYYNSRFFMVPPRQPVLVKVSPFGVAFNAAGGSGTRRVSISMYNDENIVGGFFTHTWNNVDFVDWTIPGWIVMTLGDFQIGYAPVELLYGFNEFPMP